jgi:hypothetical protein
MFVTTGGLDMLLTRTLQHTQQMAAVGADGCGGGAPPDLLLQLLVFLQTLLGWGIGKSVRRGAAQHMWLCCVAGLKVVLLVHACAALRQGFGCLCLLTSGA